MIQQISLGLTAEPFILTPEEARRQIDPNRESLHCIKCWTPHRLDLPLPHMCDRCGHLMLVVRLVRWPLSRPVLLEAGSDIINETQSKALADMWDAEDRRIQECLYGCAATHLEWHP